MKKLKSLFVGVILVLALAASAHAATICGTVQSITNTTQTEQVPDDNIGGSGPSPTPIVVVQLVDAKGGKTEETLAAYDTIDVNLMIAAFTTNAKVCYNDITGDATISR